MVKVVASGTDVTINFLSSKVASLNVEPTAVTPLTPSNITISSSVNPFVTDDFIVTVVEEAVLVKVHPVRVTRIGCMS